MKNVTAIIVTHNSAGAVGAALAALRGQPEVARILVVDNASDDQTCEAIGTHCPEAILLKSDKNLGFGAGNNLALARVDTEFALLVNPDAALRPGALAALLAAAERYPDAGILAPRLFHDDGREQPSHKTPLFERERQRTPYLTPEGDLCAGFLSGALWLVRMAALRQTGFFDPGIFFYYEDDDLCLRMRAAGYAAVLVADAQAVHGMGKSSPPTAEGRRFRLYHHTRSRLYMEYKYRGREAAQRMGARRRRRYRLLSLSGIPSLMARYRPRFRAARDFMGELAALPD